MQKFDSKNIKMQIWKKFLFIKVPISIFIVLISIELFSMILKNIRPLRHPLDNLLYNLENSKPINSKVVLFGDSVTQDIASVFDLSHEGNVANLTTNMANGIIGVLLLYKRYIKINKKPEAVIIAASPEFLGYSPQKEARRLYLSSVFTNKEEQLFLKTILKEKDNLLEKNNILSISRFKEKVILPVLGLLFRKKNNKLAFGNIKVPPEIDKTFSVSSNPTKLDFSRRTDSPPTMSKDASRALTMLCKILEENKTKLLIAWAPMPKSTWNAWKENNIFEDWQKLILHSNDNSCKKASFYDFSSSLNYSDLSFRDINHLKRNGWTKVYAIQLNNYIGSNIK